MARDATLLSMSNFLLSPPVPAEGEDTLLLVAKKDPFAIEFADDVSHIQPRNTLINPWSRLFSTCRYASSPPNRPRPSSTTLQCLHRSTRQVLVHWHLDEYPGLERMWCRVHVTLDVYHRALPVRTLCKRGYQKKKKKKTPVRHLGIPMIPFVPQLKRHLLLTITSPYLPRSIS